MRFWHFSSCFNFLLQLCHNLYIGIQSQLRWWQFLGTCLFRPNRPRSLFGQGLVWQGVLQTFEPIAGGKLRDNNKEIYTKLTSLLPPRASTVSNPSSSSQADKTAQVSAAPNQWLQWWNAALEPGKERKFSSCMSPRLPSAVGRQAEVQAGRRRAVHDHSGTDAAGTACLLP